MTTYSTDTFNRANSTTVLGSTDGAGTVDPVAWVQVSGTWGINGNRAYTSASALAHAYIETGQADVVLSITLAVIDANACGLIFRFTDASNYWRLVMSTSGTTIVKRAAAAETILGGTVAGAAAGDVITAVARGSSISAYRNGVLTASVTDSFNSTATKHGLRINSTTVVRLDNWSAGSLAALAQPVNVTQVQTPTLTPITAFPRTLTATQTQTPTITRPGTISQTLTATQVQV